MGLWSAILPLATVNIVENPSFELNTSWWATGGGNTLVRSAEQSYKGAYSAKITWGASATILQVAPTVQANKTYFFHCRIYVPTGWDGGDIQLRSLGYTGSADTINSRWLSTDDKDAWQYLETKIELAADNAGFIEIYTTSVPSASKFMYVDALVLEQQDNQATTYCDGDQEGCEWNAAEHASTSFRIAQSRAGGHIVDLEDYNFRVRQFDGIGMPPLDQQILEQALLDGAEYQGRKILPRYFLLTGAVYSTISESDFHSKRKSIINAINPDVVKGAQPILFRYSGADENKDIEIAAVYDRGLDYSSDLPLAEKLALRLLAPDPYFYELGDTAFHLTINKSMAIKYVFAKIDDEWDALGPPSAVTDPGGGIYVYAITQRPNRDIYIGGDFLNWDGIANADYIAKWNGSAWSALTTGLNGDCRGLAVDAAGNVYVAGNFTTAGGFGANYIAMWDGSGWNVLGVGLNGIAEDVVIGPDGTVYVCGQFTTAGGGAANRIAKWDGAAWSALGTGLNDTAEKMAIAPNGDLYVCGAFTTAGGVAVNYIAKWDGAAWSALGSGANSVVDAVDVDKKGILYAGGQFTDIGTRAASWNGQAWSALGSGVDNRVREIRVDDDTGLVWFGGIFTTAGGLAVEQAAIWNGSSWVRPDFDFSAAVTVWAIFIKNGDIYIGRQGAETSLFSELNTINNGGTARAYPQIVLKRSGGTSASLQYIKNETTGKVLWLDYSLLNGEKITLDFRPRKRRITSSAYGSVMGRAILRPSDFADFYLQPGDNDISVFVSTAGAPTMMAYALWRNSHVAADGAAA